MGFTLGRRKLIVNQASDFPLSFYDNNFAPSTALLGTLVNIPDFGRFRLNDIHKVVGLRGNAGTRQNVQLSAANITVAGTIPANTQVIVRFNVETWNQEAEYSRFFNDPGHDYFFNITLQPGETVATFLAKLYNAIAQDSQYKAYKSTIVVDDPATVVSNGFGTFNAFNEATSITTLDIFAATTGLEFEMEIVGTIGDFASPFVTLSAPPTLITPQYEGANNYNILKSVFIDEHRLDYHITRKKVALEGELYASIQFEMITNYASNNVFGSSYQPDHIIAANSEFEILIRETETAYAGDLVDFFNRATVLSTANPSLYDAPVWYDGANPPVVTTAALFKP